jgi:hypothetical protein
MAGCPKCARDLLAVNLHKNSVVHPNGFATFQDLREGETINLPAKWFNGDLDRRPKAYFAALPYHDGVTPGVGSAGVLNDYATLDAASAAVAALAVMDDRTFNLSADTAGALIDQSIREADGNTNPGIAAYAQATHIATSWAKDQNTALSKSLAAGDSAATTVARQSAQTALSTALESAHLALGAIYGDAPPPNLDVVIGPAKLDAPSVVAAAQAAAAAILANPNFCSLVAQPGSPVNAAVHAFKIAWNAANPGSPVPIGTGNYEQATADVLSRVLGSAPPACGARPLPAPSPAPSPAPDPLLVQAPTQGGLSTGALFGIGLLGAGAVGGAIFLATRDAKPSRLREPSRHRPFKYTDHDEEDEETNP